MHTLLSTLTILPVMTAPGFTLTPITDDAEFEAPVELTAGGASFANIRYPSPVLRDLDGDGQHELIVGELSGHLFRAKRLSADPTASWGATRNITATDGESIKFSNW